MKKKRTEITVETERVLVIRRGRHSVSAWCDGCAQQVQVVTAEEAASIVGVSRRTIYRWADAEKIHFTEISDGRLLICTNSLDACRQEKRDEPNGPS
ncbi:MAG: helix-turn-helix domain-containing protein [Acidobacteria bacterium]|nr:helix-turn-helix domain-containing protein [Acidobacteriota bacterium]